MDHAGSRGADRGSLPHDVARLHGERAALLTGAAQLSQDYLASLATRAVAPDPAAVAALDTLDEPLPEHARGGEATLRRLAALGSPASMASAGGRFFGFVVGGALPVTVAAHWLATAWDQNANLAALAPGACAFEAVACRWLADALGFAPGTHCALTTCTTTADMAALLCARQAVLARHGWDVTRRGLAGSPPLRVIVGDEVHTSMLRALSVIGVGRDQIHRVPVDGQGRMRADQLPAVDGPTIVCVQAGNVNTGAFDPLEAILDQVQPRGAWVHLDGAFGAWAAVSRRLRHHVAGIERVDSCASDGHKWLNTPYDCGLMFVRDPAPLVTALALRGDYLIQDPRDPMNTTLDASRRARGVDVWAAIHALGRAGLEAMIDDSCRLARRFADGLAAAGVRVLNEVCLNQVLVAFGDATETRRVVTEIQRDGTCWCSGTQWQGHEAMRISVSSWATTDADVDVSLAAILRIAARR